MNQTLALAARAATICIAASLGCFTANASTAPFADGRTADGDPLKYYVRYADLNLSNMEGVTALYARLRHAAQEVCGPDVDNRELVRVQKYGACLDQAVAQAVAKIDRPLLSQYHQSHAKGDRVRQVQLARTN